MNYIRDFCEKLSDEKLYRVINQIKEASLMRGTNGNFTIAVTLLFLKCLGEMR